MLESLATVSSTKSSSSKPTGKSKPKTISKKSTKVKKIIETKPKSKSKSQIDNIDKINDEIKKLEEEIRNKRINNSHSLIQTKLTKTKNIKNKINTTNENRNTNTNTNENTSTITETHIDETKKALIKLLVDAKKNKNNQDKQSTESVESAESTESSETSETSETTSLKKSTNLVENFMNIIPNTDNTNQLTLNINERRINNKIIQIIDDSVDVDDYNQENNQENNQEHKEEDNHDKVEILVDTNGINQIIEDMITELDIYSDKVTDSECYNDYMINLKDTITLTDINIKHIELPQNHTENITIGNNQLHIKLNGVQQEFELEENYYNREEIRDFLNGAFESYNFAIQCILEEDVFAFRSEFQFDIFNNENSILPILGFSKKIYTNKNIYRADKSMDIGDNIFYLVIENISDEPIYQINNDTKQITKLFVSNTPIQTDHLIIKFYKHLNLKL
jgi:hypothetical protein